MAAFYFVHYQCMFRHQLVFDICSVMAIVGNGELLIRRASGSVVVWKRVVKVFPHCFTLIWLEDVYFYFVRSHTSLFSIAFMRASRKFSTQPSVYHSFQIANHLFERVYYLRACAEQFTIAAIIDYIYMLCLVNLYAMQEPNRFSKIAFTAIRIQVGLANGLGQ